MSAQVHLRAYQTAAIDALRAHIRAGKRRLLVVLPTGGGKTVIAAAIVLNALARGRRVLFAAHRRELIYQCRAKLLAAGIAESDIGIMMANDPLTNLAAPIQIASVDTLRNRDLPQADLLIIDEAHRSLSNTYLKLIEHYTSQGATLLGLTATPYRADGGGLGNVYEHLEVVATPRQLIAEGFIAEPRVFAPSDGPDLRGVRTRGGDYVESDLLNAMNKSALVGDVVEHWRKHGQGLRTVVFAVTVAHSEAIAERFRAAGVAFEHLDGETPAKERDAILARLEAGEIQGVSNVGVLCEGWDMPSVKCCILARPTKSTGLYLQQAGRILRPWCDVRPIILDHAGNALAHGLPQDDREFSLDTSQKREARKVTRRCRECGAICAQRATACPECGARFERAERDLEENGDGELSEIDPGRIEALRRGWDELVTRWTTLNEARLSRGLKPIKPGFVWYKFKDTFGVAPPRAWKLPPEYATDDEKRAALIELKKTALERGYKPGWAVHRFVARFGHPPGGAA